MTRHIQHSIELGEVKFNHPALWADFSVDGFSAHGEFPYSHFINFLHDHPEGPTFQADGRTCRPIIYASKWSGDGECFIGQEIINSFGEYEQYFFKRTLREVAQEWAEMIPLFLRDAINCEEISRFIVSEDEARAYEEESGYPFL